jgi:hypothetical protein
MDDLWTRKPSNAMAHHKAADFANGVRSFSGRASGLGGLSPDSPVRPDGAYHQWRKVPSRELSIDLVADERPGGATGLVEAS